mgnify:FL=1
MGSLYSEYRTWLHGFRAGFKLFGLVIAGIAIFIIQPLWALAAVAALCAGVLVSLGPATQPARRLLVAVLVAALLVAGFHVWMGTWQLGVASALRLFCASSLGVALTVTTRTGDVVAVLEWLLQPLRPLGVQPERLSLQLALMLRFTEHFFVQWKKLDEAHRLRTGRAGGLRLIAPLTVQMLQTARRVGEALFVRLG